MDQETRETKESASFNSQLERTPLEHSAMASSVPLVIDGVEYVVGSEGNGALSIAELFRKDPFLVSKTAGVQKGLRTIEESNFLRKQKNRFGGYITFFGVDRMVEFMSNRYETGIELGELDSQGVSHELRFFVTKEGESVITEENSRDYIPCEEYQGVVEYKGVEDGILVFSVNGSSF